MLDLGQKQISCDKKTSIPTSILTTLSLHLNHSAHHHHHLPPSILSSASNHRSLPVMAFRSTLIARGANKHISTYGTVLDRFMVSNSAALASSSSSTSSEEASSSTTPAEALFKPTKSASTGCWHPPKYSLRRQAALVREAALTGQLSILPDGPKTSRIAQRLHRLQKSHAFEQTAAQYQYVPTTTTTAGTSARPERLGARVVKPSQRVSYEERQAALNAARLQAKDVGPYAGRAKIFKGSRVDKDKGRRSEDVKNKLGAMQQTVDDWQSVSFITPSPYRPFRHAGWNQESER